MAWTRLAFLRVSLHRVPQDRSPRMLSALSKSYPRGRSLALAGRIGGPDCDHAGPWRSAIEHRLRAFNYFTCRVEQAGVVGEAPC